jgi:nitrite reductase (NADH) large subunit
MSDRFANFIDSPSSVPQQVWLVARYVVLAGLIGIIIGALVAPDDTLTLFWGLLVPTLPAVWMLAPGLWRNTCPLATANQTPRVFGFSQERTTPPWFQTFAFSIGTGVFITLVLTRKVVFNTSGLGLALLLATTLALAFTGGFLFKGKSGWCSSVCPLLPIQRLYGQAPVQRVANAHCDPCVGCAKNCFDFNPGVAYVADMHDSDERFVGQRHLFAGAFPGLVLAFFTVGIPDDIGVVAMYGRSIIWILGSVAIFRLCDLYLAARDNTFPPLFAATGFVLFYWYSLPRMAAALESLIGGDWQLIVWPGRVLAMLVAANFVRLAFTAETDYISETAVALSGATANIPEGVLTVIEGPASVKFVGNDEAYPANASPSILDVAEAAGMTIDAGCRMGVCGADPVAVVSGRGGLSAPLPSEISTLSRLGLGHPNRMACVARVNAPCTVSLTPDTSSVPVVEEPTFAPDASVGRVVVIGNGIAGVTAADYVRRNHPDCSIDVVSLEAHNLYNRMSISKLIYTAKGTSSLNLLDDEWFERNRIEPWLNTTVRYIDTAAKRVELGGVLTHHDVGGS